MIIAGLRRHRFAVVAIALISGFLLYTLVIARPDDSSAPSETPTTTYVAEAPPTEVEEDHGDGTDADHNTPMGVAGQYRVVARGFAQDFTTPGTDWLDRVSRWVTPHLAQAYTSTDIRRVQLGAAGRPHRILHRSFCFGLHRHLRHRTGAGDSSGVQLHRVAGQHLPTDENCVTDHSLNIPTRRPRPHPMDVGLGLLSCVPTCR